MKEYEGFWALNIKKGTTIRNDDLGELPGMVAVPINERQVSIAKHLINVVVLEKVVLKEEE